MEAIIKIIPHAICCILEATNSNYKWTYVTQYQICFANVLSTFNEKKIIVVMRDDKSLNKLEELVSQTGRLVRVLCLDRLE
jgi:hypothetical protein